MGVTAPHHTSTYFDDTAGSSSLSESNPWSREGTRSPQVDEKKSPNETQSGSQEDSLSTTTSFTKTRRCKNDERHARQKLMYRTWHFTERCSLVRAHCYTGDGPESIPCVCTDCDAAYWVTTTHSVPALSVSDATISGRDYITCIMP